MSDRDTARTHLSLAEMVDGVRSGDRAVLARAITLIESTKPEHRTRADDLLQALLPFSGGAHRVGITGVPGVGKSTTIDQLGINLVEAGHRVAVLAVDPTSRRTGGSILGDKTRMNRLAVHPHAFIRPSPTSGTLGGVAAKTRETMVLVEAAGFDVVIVETVGVGQSETAVADMVDFFLVLLLAGGGDDLQGIKKGIIELADMIAINKADGDNIPRATRSAAEYQAALSILTPASETWQPTVVTVSGRDNTGLEQLWGKIREHKARREATGEYAERRRQQAVSWMHELLRDRLIARAAGMPWARDAGGYLCNALLYHASAFGRRHDRALRTGFIHLPAGLANLRQQPKRPPQRSRLTWAEALRGGLLIIGATLGVEPTAVR